jgi:hypothetical protein
MQKLKRMKTRKEAHRGWSSQFLSLKMMWTFLLLLVISLASAQSLSVKGVVKDNQGLGLPGVSVRIQGENKGTSLLSKQIVRKFLLFKNIF